MRATYAAGGEPVTDLVLVLQHPVAGVVELLADVLERAQAGEVRAIALAADCGMEAYATAYDPGDGSTATLYMAIDQLKLRLLEQ